MKKKKSVNVFIVVYMYMYSAGYLVADLTTLAAGIRTNCKSLMTVLGGVITLLNMLNVALCLPVLCELNWNKTPGAESMDRGAERPTA